LKPETAIVQGAQSNDPHQSATPPLHSHLPSAKELTEALMREARAKRQQQAEDLQALQNHRDRLSAQAAQRILYAEAFQKAYTFPNEENQFGRKPSPEGFQRWAQRFADLAQVIEVSDQGIPGLALEQRLRDATAADMPVPLKFAVAVCLLALTGPAEEVEAALKKANNDPQLRLFVLWLPFLCDILWCPIGTDAGVLCCAEVPEGTSLGEKEQAEAAFGWRPFSLNGGMKAKNMSVNDLATAATQVDIDQSMSPAAHLVSDTDKRAEAHSDLIDNPRHKPKSRRGPLEMSIIDNPRTVQRGSSVIEFNDDDIAWRIFSLLEKRHPGYYPTRELGHDALNPKNKDVDPSDNLVNKYVGRLHRLLSSLEIDPKFCRGQGYRLEPTEDSESS
jgi:hypothetical protein